MKHLFFTGPSCSGCTALKNVIESKQANDQFEFIDVEEEPLKARHYGIRSLPTIITDKEDYHVGLQNAMGFIKKL